MENKIKLLNINKASTFKNIPQKVLKSSAYSCLETLTKLFKDTKNLLNFQMNYY